MSPADHDTYIHKNGRLLNDSENWVALCKLCNDFCLSRDFQRVLRRELLNANYVNSLSHMSESAVDCLLCKQLLNRYLSENFDTSNPSQTARAAIAKCKFEIVDKIEVRMNSLATWDRSRRNALVFSLRALGSDQDWPFSLETLFWVFAASDNFAAKYFTSRDVVKDVNSDASWNQAIQWLTCCIKTHPKCGSNEMKPLPTRVVDVSGKEPKLYCSQREPQHYAALSYCWGVDQPLKTTHQNIQAYTEQIPSASLPQTLQDAITATRRLGLRYLWIDALCIIQNDETDRMREIQRMREVFTFSAVTLIAASAEHAESGFLGPRPDPWPVSLRLPYLCPTGMLATIMLRSDDWYQYDPNADATEQRAWCLEESILPYRMLIFSSSHLRWRCQTAEDCLGGHLHNRLKKGSTRLATRPQRETDEVLVATEDDELWDSWQDVLQDYTRRELTRPEDKLPAIAGLADEYQRATGDRYLAGLWESHLAEDLLWFHPYENPKLRPRPASYRAPSWSWASIDSVVRRFRGEQSDTEHFEVLGCSITLASEDFPLGQVIDGRLLVRSCVRLAIWDPVNSDLYEPDDPSNATERLMTELWPDWRDTAVPIGQAEPDAIESASSQPRYVLCLSIGTMSGVDDGQEGLVLVRATEVQTEVVYRRVACFELPEGDDWFEDADKEDIMII